MPGRRREPSPPPRVEKPRAELCSQQDKSLRLLSGQSTKRKSPARNEECGCGTCRFQGGSVREDQASRGRTLSPTSFSAHGEIIGKGT
ncbi:hypothetical protein Y1Q_0005356 [Alligator mississippiensis]|uniref:Uncharacterized protein n=1 Tax=Alligator mississippiensis TaxID=8496 RepID=A0A151MVI9_ALLMI|nr:hypothetical protein Y1Q_0005356 [Alligator mississippiensis]